MTCCCLLPAVRTMPVALSLPSHLHSISPACGAHLTNIPPLSSHQLASGLDWAPLLFLPARTKEPSYAFGLLQCARRLREGALHLHGLSMPCGAAGRCWHLKVSTGLTGMTGLCLKLVPEHETRKTCNNEVVEDGILNFVQNVLDGAQTQMDPVLAVGCPSHNNPWVKWHF